MEAMEEAVEDSYCSGRVVARHGSPSAPAAKRRALGASRYEPVKIETVFFPGLLFHCHAHSLDRALKRPRRTRVGGGGGTKAAGGCADSLGARSRRLLRLLLGRHARRPAAPHAGKDTGAARWPRDGAPRVLCAPLLKLPPAAAQPHRRAARPPAQVAAAGRVCQTWRMFAHEVLLRDTAASRLHAQPEAPPLVATSTQATHVRAHSPSPPPFPRAPRCVVALPLAAGSHELSTRRARIVRARRRAAW